MLGWLQTYDLPSGVKVQHMPACYEYRLPSVRGTSCSRPCTCHDEDRTSPSWKRARRPTWWSLPRTAAHGTPSPQKSLGRRMWAWSEFLSSWTPKLCWLKPCGWARLIQEFILKKNLSKFIQGFEDKGLNLSGTRWCPRWAHHRNAGRLSCADSKLKFVYRQEYQGVGRGSEP